MQRLLWLLATLALLTLSTAQPSSPSSSSVSSSSPPSCSAADATTATTSACAATATSSPLPNQLPPNTDVHALHVLFVSIAIKGHAQPLLRIAKEMKQRGYSVAFATHESGRDWVTSHKVPFVSAGAFPISADDLRTKLKIMTWDSSNFRGILTMFNDMYVAAARPMFDQLLPQLQSSPPALIVMDIASIGAQDLAHRLRVPHIINSPSIMFDLGGAPNDVPAWGTGFSVTTPSPRGARTTRTGRGMSLWNRCMNLLFPRLLSVALTPPFSQLNKMRYELALRPYRSQHDIFKGTRVLLNTAFGLEHAQPLSPLIEPVGPILPLDFDTSNLQIDPVLRAWLEKKAATPPTAAVEPTPTASSSWNLLTNRAATATAPGTATATSDTPERPTTDNDDSAVVVYMNLGTMSYIDAWQSEALVNGLTMHSDEPQIKVLWVLPSDQRGVVPADLPPTFKVKSPHAVSSLDVLAHAAVRVVISHCGMVSAQEALVMGKPLLCIPFHVDQPDIAARVVDAGAGKRINKNLLTAEQVHDAVVALLRDPQYAANATRVGRLLQRAGGTARAIEIIDATLRLGCSHLATIDMALPWHKTAMLDVYAVYAAMFCVLALVLRIVWLLVYFAVAETCGFVSTLLFGPPETEDEEREHTSASPTEDQSPGGSSSAPPADPNAATNGDADASTDPRNGPQDDHTTTNGAVHH